MNQRNLVAKTLRTSVLAAALSIAPSAAAQDGGSWTDDAPQAPHPASQDAQVATPPPPAGFTPAMQGAPQYAFEGPHGYVAVPSPTLRKRRSTGLMASGIVMTSVGALGALVGTVIFSAADTTGSCSSEYGSSYSIGCEDEEGKALGLGMMLGGAALVAVGIPLIIVGGKKVTVPRNEAVLVVSPRSAALKVSF